MSTYIRLHSLLGDDTVTLESRQIKLLEQRYCHTHIVMTDGRICEVTESLWYICRRIAEPDTARPELSA